MRHKHDKIITVLLLINLEPKHQNLLLKHINLALPLQQKKKKTNYSDRLAYKITELLDKQNFGMSVELTTDKPIYSRP
ncbi:hypothetical protein PR048_006396 [Dryococelus australis]|uniref:Uncharacterized protein n=1 Tax=Dryococelus australis TaxID=614101 RepID=A0ABQ9IAV4_9NEOP|nr:hypothetical protein PR048_006396 [Dryococelus australis]